MEKIRLVHLSDVHVSAAPLEWQLGDWFNKRFAAWFNYRCLGRSFRFRHADEILAAFRAEQEKHPADCLIFSGDATALGFEVELKKAAHLLGVGLWPGLAVPGNHDYCTRPAAASGLFEKYFAPWQEGRRLDEAIYPFARRVGTAWLIGVNTATGNRWAWDASGAAGPEQCRRLDQLLKTLEPGPRILVTHYPVCLANGKRERRSHGLRDLENLVDTAARGQVCLWLHGHRHHPYFLGKPLLAPFPVLCAGTATQAGLWSYGEYTLEESRINVTRKVYDPQAKTFREGEQFHLNISGTGQI